MVINCCHLLRCADFTDFDWKYTGDDQQRYVVYTYLVRFI